MTKKHAYTIHPSQHKKIYTAFLNSSFKAGDYAITLTFLEQSKSPKAHDLTNFDTYNSVVRNFLIDVHELFLTTALKSAMNLLKCAYVFERIANQTNVHMILEASTDKRLANINQELLLRLFGTDMLLSEEVNIVAVEKIQSVNTWLEYMFRDLGQTEVISAHFNENDWNLNVS